MTLARLSSLTLVLLIACGGGGSELHINEHHTAPDDDSAEPSDPAAEATGGDPELRAVPSQVNYSETVDRLHRAFRERGIEVVATVDHTGEGESDALQRRPTTLFIFRVEQPGGVVHENPTMALDLPQRMLVYTTGQSDVFIVWRRAAALADDHGAEDHSRIAEIDQLLEELAAIAAAPAPTDGQLR